MDGDPVTGEPSAPITYTDAFSQLFPQYMVMGMTYDEYWNGHAILTKYYREAYDLRNHNDEWDRWRRGAYFYDALLRVAPVMRTTFGNGKVEAGKYPEEPWPLTEKEAKEREIRRERENTERFIKQLEAESERNLKKLNEAKKEASGDGRD